MNNPIIKFSVILILLMLLAFSAGLYLPWWSISLVGFIMALLISMKPGQYLLAGFLAIFILWGGMAYWISVKNEHILANRIAHLILKKEQPIALILLTAFTGGLISGISCWSGSLTRKFYDAMMTKK